MRKNLLLTCLLTLVAAFGMAQSTTWPITLTRANGLPGKYAGMNYEYFGEVYSFDEAINTLRLTVISTNTMEEQTGTGTDGVSKGWGPGYPFFTLTELTVLTPDGDTIPYTASTNACAVGDGSIEALNNGNMTDHFHSTYNNGGLPQAYHYLDLQFETPVSAFKVNWVTRKNVKNMPTYVGLTPGTDYTSYPEFGIQIEKKVTTAEEIGEEGAFFVIKNNAGNFFDEDKNREYQGGGYYISPYAAPTLLDASAIVYLVPTDEEGAYKVKWLSHGRYIVNEPASGVFLNWTTKEEDAAKIKFVPCEAEGAEGDFFMTQHDSIVMYHNKKGKMATTIMADSLIENAKEYTGYNMSIYKVNIALGNTVSMLDELVADAEARVALLGDLGDYNQGEYEDILEAIDAAKALQANPTTASDILKAKLALEKAVPAYAVVAMNQYLDSLDGIIEAIANEEILISEAPDWLENSYPAESEGILQAAVDAASLVLENYTSLADVDAGIEAAIAAIDAFWASKIQNIKTLPFRVGTTQDGLPGEMQSYAGYKWESPTYRLTEATDVLRFTFIKTNNEAKYDKADGEDSPYSYVTYGEFEIYDGAGNKVELTAEDFSSNSIHPTDGVGLEGLCNGDYKSHYHSAYKYGQDTIYDLNPTYVYIEVRLPEALSSFKYVQYGRNNGVNTPVDFVISAGELEGDPTAIEHDHKYPAAIGEKITDPAQLVDGEFYAIQGLFFCDPVHGSAGNVPHFFDGLNVYGNNIAPNCVFQFTKTGDEDGSFYIRSIKDSKYWSRTIDEDGWGRCAATTDVAEAAKVLFAPCGNDGLPGSMVLYQYNDTVHRDYSDQGDISTPYLIFQDWGTDLATFSIPSLDANDKDGEGEWYIYKVNMEKPYSYWLSELMPAAEKYKDAKTGIDPGFYREADAGAYLQAYKKAEAAVAKDNEAVAKEAVPALLDALNTIKNAETIPVTAGLYMLVSSYDAFYSIQGVEKAIYAYHNDIPDDAYIGNLKYRVFWGDAPKGRTTAEIHDRFLFRFIPATEDPNLAVWREAGRITEQDSLNAFYIQHVETGGYIKGADDLYRKIGLTDTPETPFVVRSRGNNDFDFYCPYNLGNYIGYRSLQFNGHGSGGGKSGYVTTWDPTFESAAAYSARFFMRKIDDGTSIGGAVINGSEKGDVLVSTSYYTVGGAAVSAPVKGINVVKKVYANGVVETSKIYVK